ncbi:MAG: T9SS type A sorting domain-containing protein, partial [Bacteroidia bacterium]
GFKTSPESLNTHSNFAVYPVPAHDMLTLSSGIEGMTYYKIVSLDGRLVAQGSFSVRSDIQMNGLSVGSYYLEMSDENGLVQYRKLIAKK